MSPFVPPRPYRGETVPGGFWFGTDKLWVALPASGTWALGHYRPADSAFRQKLFWYRKGYNALAEPRPKLTVTGKRIDATAPPLDVDSPNGAWTSANRFFMTVGLNIPTVGCWEITGKYRDDDLSFVVWVTDGMLKANQAKVRRSTSQ
jgi:hypothetical protein